jgi:hypothetical protein
MNEELILREAVATAWSVYLATNGDRRRRSTHLFFVAAPLRPIPRRRNERGRTRLRYFPRLTSEQPRLCLGEVVTGDKRHTN